MRAAALAFVGVLVAGPTSSRADAHSWGASSGRFSVEVMVSGFDDGAGEGGWSVGDARELATWARRFNAILDARSSVSLVRDVEGSDGSGDTRLTIRRGSRTTVVAMSGGPDLDAALATVARRLGVAVPPVPPQPALYTIELFATRSEADAGALADRLEQRGVEAEDSFFHAACHPCSTPQVHVLDPGTDGQYRVVTGIFDDLRIADRSARALRTRWKIAGVVRAL